jgi:ELWxxDGT repeat protein
MEKTARRILQTTMILMVIGIAVNAQPVLVKEIPSGSSNFNTIGDLVYFTSGDALWRTDGTPAGTLILKTGFTELRNFREFNGLAIFTDNNPEEIWKSDGTPAGTVLLKTLSGSNNVIFIDETANYLFFRGYETATGLELYRTDGTPSGTMLVRDLNPGPGNGVESAGAVVGNSFGAVVGNMLFFAGRDATNGRELWKTDGSSAGTAMIKDINPGPANGAEGPYFSYNDQLYFFGNTPEYGAEPWVSNGTDQGTFLLRDIESGPEGVNPYRYYSIVNNGEVYFFTHASLEGDSEYGATIWKTGGTPSSTVKVTTHLEDGNAHNLGPFLLYKGKVYFFDDSEGAIRLWATDGTHEGTTEVFLMGVGEGYVPFAKVVNDHILFYINVQGFPYRFERSDGTPGGTETFDYFESGSLDQGPRDVTKVNDLVFYGDHDEDQAPGDEDNYFQLIQADGFTARAVRDIHGGNFTGTVDIVNYNGKVVFTTFDNYGESTDDVKKLWIYDPSSPPTPAGVFTLVNADTDEDIQRISDNETIELPEGVNFSVRYDPVGTPGSVRFTMGGGILRTENEAPYALNGDVNGNYYPWIGPDELTIDASEFSEPQAKGTLGHQETISFQIIRQSGPGECTASGTILREQWNNVSGNNVSAIPVNSTPSSTSQLNIFEGPTNSQTNFGARIRGYICPPTTGTYTFWIASNDHSELWLSTDDSPSNKVKIASVTGATTPRQWTKFPTQKSAAINLTAGKRYYIEALHKQGAGSHNIAVGWQLPDGTLERPIPGNRLSPASGAENSNPQVYISSPGNTYEFAAPADVSINAHANDADGTITLVEFFLGSDKIGEDSEAREGEIYDASLSDLGPGTYTITAKATDNSGATSVSEPVTFTVSDYHCNTSGTITRDYWPNVSGSRVSDVPEDSWVPYTNELTIFEGPSNIGDNYATRIHGYICVPQTGGYKFWISSNDHSELRLSTDDDPANKVRIAWVTGATNPRQWDKYSTQVSATIMLQQGQLYYVEALHKEAVGTDHIAVGWQLPDGTMERPIPGNRLLHDFRSAGTSQASETSDGGNTSQYSLINIYPNPVQSGDPELTISGYEQVEAPVETHIEIMNMTGEVVFADRIQCGGNCSTYLMNVNKQLVPGVYLVNLKTNGIRNSRRLLVK